MPDFHVLLAQPGSTLFVPTDGAINAASLQGMTRDDVAGVLMNRA